MRNLSKYQKLIIVIFNTLVLFLLCKTLIKYDTPVVIGFLNQDIYPVLNTSIIFVMYLLFISYVVTSKNNIEFFVDAALIYMFIAIPHCIYLKEYSQEGFLIHLIAILGAVYSISTTKIIFGQKRLIECAQSNLEKQINSI